MHTQPGREIGRQLPPLAASLHDIQEGIRDAAKFILARTASGMAIPPRRLQQRLQPAPLCVRQITRIHALKLRNNLTSAYSFDGSSTSF
jgi:hypothetical protein